MAAQASGPKAQCLVDLGHHAPNEYRADRVAAHRSGRLAGFHFNDSKYGDHDLERDRSIPTAYFGCSTSWRSRRARRRRLHPAYMSTNPTT